MLGGVYTCMPVLTSQCLGVCVCVVFHYVASYFFCHFFFSIVSLSSLHVVFLFYLLLP